MKMGMFVKDIVTGFEGFVVGKIYWMFGCENYLVQSSKAEAGKDALISLKSMIPLSEKRLEIDAEKRNTNLEMEFIRPNLERYFGMKCRDKVSGFEGVCIGCTTSMYGSDQYALETKAKKNKSGKVGWFDEGRIEIISKEISMQEVTGSKSGGCDYIPPKPPIPEVA